MKREDIILEYVKRYYKITYIKTQKSLLFCDINEGEVRDYGFIDFGVYNGCRVSFLWAKGKQITGVDLYHKDNQSTATKLKELLYTRELEDLIVILVNDNLVNDRHQTSFQLTEIQDIFPKLFINKE